MDCERIQEVEYLKVLGLTTDNKGNNAITVATLRNVGDQLRRIIDRITHKRTGMPEKDTLRLVQTFVVSQIVYATPYLNLKKAGCQETRQHAPDSLRASPRPVPVSLYREPAATGHP